MENIFISSRGDRYGANAIPWITAIWLSELAECKLYHNCSIRCKCNTTTKDRGRGEDLVIHNFLIDKSEETVDKNIITKDILLWEWKGGECGTWPVRKITEKIYSLNDSNNVLSFPDLFHNSKLYNELNLMYDDKFKEHEIGVLHNIRQATIIHVRLGDEINNTTEKWHAGWGGESQLIELINKASKRFATPIYLMTAPIQEDIDLCKNILKRCLNTLQIDAKDVDKFVLGTDNIDFDIYLMIKCKNLIIGRSTFAFIPALLHKNQVFAEKWENLEHLIMGTGPLISKKISTLEEL
jgi:hypothetical protein